MKSLVMFAAIFFACQAQAEIYKCKDEDGKISYQGTACSKEAAGKSLDKAPESLEKELPQSDAKTGQWLISKMNSSVPNNNLEAMAWVGEILFSWEGKSHCKPPRATVGQATAITKKFLNENPQYWHEDASRLIGLALGLTWPCQR